MTEHKKLWSVGITLKWRYGRWFATSDYQSFTIGDTDNDVLGTISAKYGFSDPVTPVKIVVELAAQLGIDFEVQHIFAEQDGEGVDMPDGWRETLHEVARAVGFSSPYKLTESEG